MHSRTAERTRPFLRKITIFMLVGYRRVISPLLPDACRFYPSCSMYAAQAVEKHGVIRGLWLGLRRLSRCHALNPGGYDPVG